MNKPNRFIDLARSNQYMPTHGGAEVSGDDLAMQDAQLRRQEEMNLRSKSKEYDRRK